MSQDLTKGAMLPLVFRFSSPMILGLLAVFAVNLTDAYFVGQLGTAELAAVSLTFPVATLLMGLAVGLGTAAASCVARSRGRGDFLLMKQFATQSLCLSTLIVIVVASLGILTIEPLFSLLGADAKTLPFVYDYMQIWYPGMVFLVIPMVGNSCIRAAGEARWPAILMVFSAILNGILDPLFIFGWYGFPELGVKGAALATLIARAFTLVAAIYILGNRQGLLTSRFHDRGIFWLWRKLLNIGLPAALGQMVVPLSAGLLTALVARLGTDEVAAFGVATRIEAIALIPVYALAAGISPLVGQNWGAKDFHRSRRFIQLTLYLCWGACVLVAILLAFVPAWVIPSFTSDPQVVAVAQSYFWLVAWSYAWEGSLIVTTAAFSAMAMPLPAICLTLFRSVFLLIPLAFLGSYLAKAPGIFIAVGLANFLGGFAARLYQRPLFRWQTSVPMPKAKDSFPERISG